MTVGLIVIVAAICLGAWLFRDTVVARGFVALMGPIGVVLPLLVLRHIGAELGLSIQTFGTIELLVFLMTYVVFLVAAMGAVPVDMYRWGYAPLPVAAMVLALCGYGALTGSVFIPLVAVTGQALWVMGWGSSNWFDHVLHVVLVPITIIALALRMF